MSQPLLPSLLPPYAELQCVSHYTFLHGSSSPEQLVQRAAALGYHALAIADECSLAGVVRAHQAAKQTGLKLLIGSQMTVTPEDGSPPFRLLLLAMNRNGYGNLCELITLARRRAEKGHYLLRPRDIAAPAPDLSALRGMPDCQLILLPAYGVDSEVLERQARWLAAQAPGRARIALTLHLRSRDELHSDVVQAAAGLAGLPLVATGDVVMHVRSAKPLQDTMTAIRHRIPVARCGYKLAPNAEQHLRSRLRLGNAYRRATLDESVLVAELCAFSLDELRYEYPVEIVPENMTPSSYLRQEAYLGAHWRYPQGIPHTVQDLLERELV